MRAIQQNFQHPARDPRNTRGPFYALKGYCLACGLPEELGGDLMADLEKTHLESFFIKQPTTVEELERAFLVVKCCCVNAFRYGGKNPDIIRRLGNSAEYFDYIINSSGKLVLSGYVHPNESELSSNAI